MSSTPRLAVEIAPRIEAQRSAIAALVHAGVAPRRIAQQLKVIPGTEEARSLKALIRTLRRRAMEERTSGLLQQHGPHLVALITKHGSLTKVIAKIGDPDLAPADVLWYLVQQRIDAVQAHLDAGRSFQALAELLGLPSFVSADLRRTLISHGMRRRTRQEAKQKLLAEHHTLIKSRLSEGGTYKEVLQAIGNPELTVPDLTRYVVTHKLPARLRGAPSGCQYTDPEVHARQVAVALSERAKGRTLEEIGRKLSRTKEGVRQMLLRANLPAQRCVIAQRRLKIIPSLVPLLQQGLSHDGVAHAWNKGKPAARHITANFVAGLCAAAEKHHYEQLESRLAIAEIHRPEVRNHWSFLPELIAGMAEVRATLALRGGGPSGKRKARDPKIVAEERREQLARYVKAQPALYMTTMAKAAKLERADIQRLLYGSGEPTDAEWSKLCAAYPGLEQLGYEMPFPGADPAGAQATQELVGS